MWRGDEIRDKAILGCSVLCLAQELQVHGSLLASAWQQDRRGLQACARTDSTEPLL
jgi:hypothetical protein